MTLCSKLSSLETLCFLKDFGRLAFARILRTLAVYSRTSLGDNNPKKEGGTCQSWLQKVAPGHAVVGGVQQTAFNSLRAHAFTLRILIGVCVFKLNHPLPDSSLSSAVFLFLFFPYFLWLLLHITGFPLVPWLTFSASERSSRELAMHMGQVLASV